MRTIRWTQRNFENAAAQFALVAALTLATVTACSSSNGDTAPAVKAAKTAQTTTPAATPTANDTAALEKAVSAYTAALFSGNATGYDYLSARCRKQMTKSDWTATAKDAHQQYGAQKATGVHVDQLAGGLARVSYGAGNIPQFEREGQAWTREGGTWRWDACPATK